MRLVIRRPPIENFTARPGVASETERLALGLFVFGQGSQSDYDGTDRYDFALDPAREIVCEAVRIVAKR